MISCLTYLDYTMSVATNMVAAVYTGCAASLALYIITVTSEQSIECPGCQNHVDAANKSHPENS